MRYFDDYAIGQRFVSAEAAVVDAAAVRDFASRFDPQPFHLDEAAAASSMFNSLAASGWHTAALTMRLVVGSDLRPAGGVIGGGVDELRWPRPVRPGDRLTLEGEVVELRPSRSKPGQGLVRVRFRTLNQHGEPVQEMVANLIVPRRSQ